MDEKVLQSEKDKALLRISEVVQTRINDCKEIENELRLARAWLNTFSLQELILHNSDYTF